MNASTTKEQAPEALRTHFEALASDPSFKLSRSRRGTYVNPAVARDWKWFQLGAIRAQQPAPATSDWDVRGHLAASLTCWHRLTGQEADELVAMFKGRTAPLDNPPMPEHWGVVVRVNGDNILCIGESYLHGKRELSEAEENAVIGVAQHLLAFVGYGLPPSSFDPDADDAARTAAQPETAHQVATQPTAPSMTLPAERSLFKEQFRHLDLEEMPDAWGRPVFKHSHVDAIWHGWRQRAAISLLDTHTRPSPTAQAAPAGATDQDGEAFRTAARLGLTLRFYGGCAQSSMPNTPSAYEVVAGGDRSAAMREAVQRAAAVIESGGESQRLDTTAQAAPAADYDHGPQSLTVAEAARHVGKWLNERPNRPLDLRDVAMLCAHAQKAPAAGAVAGPVLFVSREQLEGLLSKPDPEAGHGRYLPIRRVSAGKFTHPLYAAPTPAAQAADSVAEDTDPIRALIAQHAAILDQNESAYFELCYHRVTGWMAWITDKPLCMPPVVNPDRKVLAQGQGDTADEACADAARSQGGA